MSPLHHAGQGIWPIWDGKRSPHHHAPRPQQPTLMLLAGVSSTHANAELQFGLSHYAWERGAAGERAAVTDWCSAAATVRECAGMSCHEHHSPIRPDVVVPGPAHTPYRIQDSLLAPVRLAAGNKVCSHVSTVVPGTRPALARPYKLPTRVLTLRTWQQDVA
jgi:hypothetical protein